MSLTGRQTLSSIDSALVNENEAVAAIGRRVAEVSARLVQLQQQEAGVYRELARLHVEHLVDGSLLDSIDDTERRVLALLRAREAAAGELEREITRVEAQRRSLEDARASQADRVDEAAEAVDVAEAATQARLDLDMDYQAQRERTREAERVAVHAEEKAERSEQEREEKGRSYRRDPLFSYLWNRHYGMPDYRAGGLIRWLDGKVARLVGYADARANYARLREIPLRLREHAEQVRQRADAEFETLQQLDQQAREADGIPALEAVLNEAQQKLEALDNEIDESERRQEELQQRQQAYAAGNDEHYQKAVGYLAAEFQRDDLRALRQEALATPFPEDDVIVAQLLEHQAEREEMEDLMQELKGSMRAQRKRLQELESLRREFKRQRYDQAGSGFANGSLVAMMLESFLKGTLTRDELLRVLRQQRRYRPRHSDITFGSGGFGRGTVWNGGLGGLGRGGFGRGGFGGGGLGRAGGLGRGGGGFRTGGGF